MSHSSTDVAVIGAGAYGLSLATHLRERGIEHRVFGRPMQAWRAMPSGMYLKSSGFATTIPVPQGHPTLPEYCRTHGLDDFQQIEIATFAKYGLSLQQDLVPYVEETNVTEVARLSDRFSLTLQSGEHVLARRVVVAIGLTNFEQLPDFLAHLPPDLASHTVQHNDFAHFADRNVAVVGAGQSALQAAALLHESGSRVHLLARRPIQWGGWAARQRTLLQRMRAPGTVIGWGKSKWVLEHIPMLMHYLPAETRLQYNRTKLGPSGAWWLRERVEGKLTVSTHTRILGATIDGGRVRLRLHQHDVGTRELVVDHVIAGTGFRVDVDRLPFISAELANEILRLERAPKLSRHFESSVSNLYFIGPASVPSFGPLFRFVAGSVYAVPQTTRHIARRSGRLATTWLRYPKSRLDKQERDAA